MTHDLLSPSSAVTWFNCPGSTAYAQQVPEEPASEHAAEGTAAHAEAERAALAAYQNYEYVPASNDADMVRHARGWADVLTRLVPPKRAVYTACERKLHLASTTGRNALGTADFIGIDIKGVLTIADYKYGMGVEVSAEKNLQLSIYALAAYDEFSHTADIDVVRLVIYQPRINPEPRVYEWNLDALLIFGRKIKNAAALADHLSEYPEQAATYLNPGEAQCRWCKGRSICPALRAKTKALIAADFDVVEEAPKELPLPQTPEELARALPWLDTIERWCDGVRSHAMALATQGETIPGYKVVAGRKGVRKWTPDAEERLNHMRIAKSVLYKKALISPAQAEKARKEGLIGERQWRRISDFIIQAEGKPALAPESDKRPAISIAVKDDFNVIA